MLLAERRAATGVRTLVVRVRHTVARSILEIRGDPMAPTTRMGRVTAAACIAVMGAAGLSACTASGATDGGRTGEEATALPPGILPPNDPPQPGDARLGPDGHYDYSAPDFVLKNPCDTEYFERALELGWKVPEIGTKRRDEARTADCAIVNSETGLALTNFFSSPSDLTDAGYVVSYGSPKHPGIIIVEGKSLFGDSCFAGVETVYGVFGASSATGGFSQHSNIDDACNEAIETINPIIGG